MIMQMNDLDAEILPLGGISGGYRSRQMHRTDSIELAKPLDCPRREGSESGCVKPGMPPPPPPAYEQGVFTQEGGLRSYTFEWPGKVEQSLLKISSILSRYFCHCLLKVKLALCFVSTDVLFPAIKIIPLFSLFLHSRCLRMNYQLASLSCGKKDILFTVSPELLKVDLREDSVFRVTGYSSNHSAMTWALLASVCLVHFMLLGNSVQLCANDPNNRPQVHTADTEVPRVLGDTLQNLVYSNVG